MDKIDECCIICSDNAGESVVLSQPCNICMAYWCQSCIRMQCETATKSLGNMPPKCCQALDPRLVLQLLPEDEHDRYKKLFHEYRTEAKDRAYCPNKYCATFISPYEIKQQRIATDTLPESKDKLHLDQALPETNHKRQDSAIPTQDQFTIHCPDCSTATCVTCKQISHDGPCNIEDDPVIAQIRRFGYKRCPRCGYGTRRMWGCSHMQCVCGAHWCWSCERNYNVCDTLGGCDDDDEGSEFEDPEDQSEILENASSSGSVEGTPNATGAPNLPPPTRNLDRGSHAFWEGEALNFGDEPNSTESEGTWGCPHQFEVPANNADDNLGKQLCWDCWATTDEQFSRCWLCNLTRCAACQQLFESPKV